MDYKVGIQPFSFFEENQTTSSIDCIVFPMFRYVQTNLNWRKRTQKEI